MALSLQLPSCFCKAPNIKKSRVINTDRLKDFLFVCLLAQVIFDVIVFIVFTARENDQLFVMR